MNCNQKSGVFLKISCTNEVSDTCEICKKEVCSTHLHTLSAQKLCEDCYWEQFLYAKEVPITTNYIHEDPFIYSSTSTNNSSEESGFAGGFGGGAFGGGGASGNWTEEDANSFNANDTAAAGLLAGDDGDGTFFYS